LCLIKIDQRNQNLFQTSVIGCFDQSVLEPDDIPRQINEVVDPNFFDRADRLNRGKKLGAQTIVLCGIFARQ